MLEIKHKHHFELPALHLGASKPMELSKVPVDTDELAQDIEHDTDTHDNNWELTDHPDTSELEQFWTTVEEEIKEDPTWNDFAEE